MFDFSDSTRSLYRKKLAITMREARTEETNGEPDLIGASITNGNSHYDELQNGEYSADDEEILEPVQKENSEDEQPSLVTRPSVTPTPSNTDAKRISTRSASKTSSIVQAKAALSEVRQRFSGT